MSCLNLLGFKAAFFFALLELVNWACIGHVAAVVEILLLMQQSVLPMTLISDTLVCFFFFLDPILFGFFSFSLSLSVNYTKSKATV